MKKEDFVSTANDIRWRKRMSLNENVFSRGDDEKFGYCQWCVNVVKEKKLSK